MTFMVARRTSAQRAAFDIVSIVPSISRPWTTLPTTMTTARSHMSDAPPSWSQSPAECRQKRNGEDCPHGDHAPGGERGRRSEEKGVNRVRRTGDQEAPDVDHHRHDQHAADPLMCAPPPLRRRSRQVSADQQRLNEHETQCDDPCESGHDVDCIAPLVQRARCCSGDRHANGGCQGNPDQDRPGPSHSLWLQRGQAG